MLGRLSYEPSTQAVLAHVLPPDARVVATGGGRRPISWPVLARATGLGEIQGGEVVLVPPGRVAAILASLSALREAGVAGLILATDAVSDALAGESQAMVLALVPPDTDLRRLREDMERFIIRRRRELFELSQELHRSLVEAAIGGASVEELLTVIGNRLQKRAVLDREGDVVRGKGDTAEIPEQVLVRLRIAGHQQRGDFIELADLPTVLAAPVYAGKERRGIAILLDVDVSAPDEAEVVLGALTSACAIALGRVTAAGAPTLEDFLSATFTGPQRLANRDERQLWLAVGIRDDGVPLARLERAVTAELEARNEAFFLVREDDVLLVLTDAPHRLSWETVLSSLCLRLGSQSPVAGLGRWYPGAEGVRRSASEALHALARGEPGAVVRYEAIELEVLLENIASWEDFVAGKLGPLLEGSGSQQELRQTLRAYLAAGKNATEAARLLQIHRNTLLYRLQRLKKLLDVDLEDAEDVFALELALRLLEAHGGRVTARGDSG